MIEMYLIILIVIVVCGFSVCVFLLYTIDKNFRFFHKQWRSSDTRDLEFQRDSMQGRKNQGMTIIDIKRLLWNQIEEEEDQVKKSRLYNVTKYDSDN